MSAQPVAVRQKRKMPPCLSRVMAEARTPQHAGPDAVQSQVAPILRLATDLQKQIAEHRACLFAAETEDATMDGHTERLHQTCTALEKDVNAMVEAVRRVRLSVLQHRRYADEIAAQYDETTDA